MNITLETLIELIEDSKVQIGYQSDDTREKDFYNSSAQDTYKIKYMDVIDASKLLEQLYILKESV